MLGDTRHDSYRPTDKTKHAQKKDSAGVAPYPRCKSVGARKEFSHDVSLSPELRGSCHTRPRKPRETPRHREVAVEPQKSQLSPPRNQSFHRSFGSQSTNLPRSLLQLRKLWRACRHSQATSGSPTPMHAGNMQLRLEQDLHHRKLAVAPWVLN